MARFFCPLRYEDLSDTLVYQTKAFLLDCLSSAFAGISQPPTHMMLSLANDMKGSEETTIIPTNSRHLSLVAALVNGASSHVMEMDDLHRQSIFHPAAPILSAVFAAGEKEHVSGCDLVLGILAGYETGIRAALAAGKSHYEYWHTKTCGTFGAAAGAAAACVKAGLEMQGFPVGPPLPPQQQLDEEGKRVVSQILTTIIVL